MTTIRHPGRAKRWSAGAMAAVMIAGAGLPALAADRDADQGAAATSEGRGNMSVQEAWTNAKEDWRALQNASGDAWGDAREQFQESWSRLQRLMSEQEGTAPPPDDPAALDQGDGSD